ncbi:MAG: ATP-binding cassette domain-containing protein [Synergistaceae bacterium]|nr:ATP-binding cassette domain-containing protein [Synergistaceae bacterium]
MSLKVKNLSYTYNLGMPTETAALFDVSLEVESGEILSIVGHTGSGKSTLAQHLNGIMIPQSGEVSVNGITVSSDSKDLRKIRREVGLVFQYPEQQIFAETVEEEIAFGPYNWGVRKEDLHSRVRAAVRMIGLDESILPCNPFTLSGGQKRCVAIASVLSSDPSYIVLDEPTAGLDARGARELLAVLRSRADRGIGIIHITHDLDLALRISTKILVLENGKQILCGSPRETAELLRSTQVLGLALPDVLKLSFELRESGLINSITWDPHELAKMITEAG